MKAAIIATGVFVVILLVYLGAYAYSAQHLEVTDLSFELSGVSAEGFSLMGDLTVLNNGLVPVGIEYATYSVFLDEELANGSVVVDSWVWPGETEDYSVTVDVNWAPAAELALNLLTPEGTFVTVSGDIYLVGSVSIPFEVEVDVEPFLKQFIKDTISENVGNLIDSVKNWFG